jgi:hypothetical protein
VRLWDRTLRSRCVHAAGTMHEWVDQATSCNVVLPSRAVVRRGSEANRTSLHGMHTRVVGFLYPPLWWSGCAVLFVPAIVVVGSCSECAAVQEVFFTIGSVILAQCPLPRARKELESEVCFNQSSCECVSYVCVCVGVVCVCVCVYVCFRVCVCVHCVGT